MSMISEKIIALLKTKMESYTLNLENVKKNLSAQSIGIGFSVMESDDCLAFMLEVYLDAKEDIGLILTIEVVGNKSNFITGQYYISKESGGFFLSPRSYVIENDTITDEFIILLDEYFDVLNLAIINFVFDYKSYLLVYNNVNRQFKVFSLFVIVRGLHSLIPQ